MLVNAVFHHQLLVFRKLITLGADPIDHQVPRYIFFSGIEFYDIIGSTL